MFNNKSIKVCSFALCWVIINWLLNWYEHMEPVWNFNLIWLLNSLQFDPWPFAVIRFLVDFSLFVFVFHRRQNVSDTKPSSRFLVRCLGSLPLAEDQLSDDRSGRAISQCISNLSHQPSESLETGRLLQVCIELWWT